MAKVSLNVSRKKGEPRYSFLEPVVDLLLAHGNQLSTNYRWGSNPTGYFCLLKEPLNLALIEQHFELPESIQIDHTLGCIDYGLGTIVIRQG